VELANKIRQFRRECALPFDTSVIWDIPEKELRVFTDAGRICRPLFIVEPAADGPRMRYTAEHAFHLRNKVSPLQQPRCLVASLI
jgi:DNA-directed RNA polymerase II subunit RPB2